MAEPRRWFIGAATTQHRPETGLSDVPVLAGEVGRFRDLFTELGYRAAPGFGVGLGVRDLASRLRAFVTDAARTGDEIVVVYYAGHALTYRGDLLLPMADTDHDLLFNSMHAGDLTTRLLVGAVGVRRLLFILDTCHAAVGGGAVAKGGIDFVNRLHGLADNPAVGVVVAARPEEQAAAGVFGRAFTTAVRTPEPFGPEPDLLSLDRVVDAVNENTPPWQHARLFFSGDSVTPFLPNPRVKRWLRSLDDRTAARYRQQSDRRAELTAHVLPHARGIDAFGAQNAWFFTGRQEALRALCEWLRDRSSSGMVVTGGPGSGKSSVLSRLYVLSRRRLRGQIPNLHTLPPDTIPDDDSIVQFVHARGKTARDLLEGVAAACGVDGAISPGHLLQELHGRTPVTVVVDAVDEAADPGGPVHGWFAPLDEVLIPLMSGSPRSPLRLLIGTRRHLVGRFDPHQVIDLDTAPYCDPGDLREYVTSCLVELNEASPYRGAGAGHLADVASAIAEAADKSFLVALITARRHALRAGVADPDDPTWREALPRYADESMRDDLAERLGPEAPRARDLLLPLAYARGAGLPWEDVWPRLASALAGRPCASTDIEWLMSVADYYVIEEGGGGHQPVYRLYHQALADHLRAQRDEVADQTAIVDTLIQHTPRSPDGQSVWARAHPYLKAHLASHAAATDRLDDLITDPRFLLAAATEPLLNALGAARARPARLAADAYRRAAGLIRTAEPAQHAAYLQLAARCGRAPELADAITDSGVHLTWTTRWAAWRLQPPHRSINSHGDGVWSVALAKLDGRSVIVSGGLGRSVRFHDAATGGLLSDVLAGDTDGVWSVAAGEVAGRPVIVTGGADGLVRVWDTTRGIDRAVTMAGHVGGVWAVAIRRFSETDVVVSGGDDGTVRLWDAVTGVAVAPPITGHLGGVNAVALIRVDDHDLVVSGGGDGLVRLFDVASGAAYGSPLAGHAGAVWSLCGGEVDGRTVIVSGGLDGSVRLWDPAGECTAVFTGHGSGVNAVAVGQVGQRGVVVSGGDDGTVRVWDINRAREMTHPFTGHTNGVRSVAIGTVDGRSMIVSGGSDGTVRIWDAAAGAPVTDPFSGHSELVRAVAFAAGGRREVIISVGDDSTVRVWDAATGEAAVRPLTSHIGPVNGVDATYLDDSLVVASGGADGVVLLWRPLENPQRMTPLTGHPGGVWSVAVGFLAGRCVVLSGGADGLIRIWDPRTGEAAGGPLEGHRGGVNTVVAGEIDGRAVIVSGGADRTVRIWDAETGAQRAPSLTGHSGAVWAVAIGEIDGTTVIVSGSDDRTVRLWDPKRGTPLGPPLTGHHARVWSVACGRADDESLIVSGGDDQVVRVWRASDRTAKMSLTGHSGGVIAVAMGSVDGRAIVVSGSADRTIRLWDAATGSVRDAFRGHTGRVTAVAAGASGGRGVVVSGGDDRRVRVWDGATGKRVGQPLSGHTDTVTSLALGWIGKQQIAVSGGADGTVRLWDTITAAPIGKALNGHAAAVSSVAIGSVDGVPTIVSGGADHTIRAWDAGDGEPRGRRLVGHSAKILSVAIGHLAGRATILSGNADGTLRMWDPALGVAIGDPLTGHDGAVNSVAIGVDARGDGVAVSGGDDGVVRVWSVLGTELVPQTLGGHGGRVRSVATGWTGRHRVVLSGAEDGILRVWALGAAAETMTVDLSAPIAAVSFVSPAACVAATTLGIVVLDLALPISTVP